MQETPGGQQPAGAYMPPIMAQKCMLAGVQQRSGGHGVGAASGWHAARLMALLPAANTDLVSQQRVPLPQQAVPVGQPVRHGAQAPHIPIQGSGIAPCDLLALGVARLHQHLQTRRPLVSQGVQLCRVQPWTACKLGPAEVALQPGVKAAGNCAVKLECMRC
jgi:hypothetical protein